jgi:hypothetical protein
MLLAMRTHCAVYFSIVRSSPRTSEKRELIIRQKKRTKVTESNAREISGLLPSLSVGEIMEDVREPIDTSRFSQERGDKHQLKRMTHLFEKIAKTNLSDRDCQEENLAEEIQSGNLIRTHIATVEPEKGN